MDTYYLCLQNMKKNLFNFIQNYAKFFTYFNAFLNSAYAYVVLHDRIKKINEVYPSETNKKKLEALEMFLKACKS